MNIFYSLRTQLTIKRSKFGSKIFEAKISINTPAYLTVIPYETRGEFCSNFANKTSWHADLFFVEFLPIIVQNELGLGDKQFCYKLLLFKIVMVAVSDKR